MNPLLEVMDWSVHRQDSFSAGPINLALSAGDVVTLMGPSGGGKTTLLLSILGYREPTLHHRGERLQRGRKLREGEIPDRALYIPQHQPFNPNWRVGPYLERLARAAATSRFKTRSSRRDAVSRALTELGLLPRRNATIAQLSGGEIQRAALAQILVTEPELLVGDEFVSALDPGMVRWVLNRCRDLLARTGGAALLALHDVPAAVAASDKIIIIWPNGLRPTVLRRDTPAWDVRTVHSLVVLARSLQDTDTGSAAGDLVAEVEQVLASGYRAGSADSSSIDLFSDDGRFDADCLSAIRAALPLQDRSEAFNTFEIELASGRLAVGVDVVQGSARRVFAALGTTRRK